ncbi:C39 family peptidase [Cellulosilyticum sp. ST5]|uniref:C39 family peptidase n=1 Tax=unclassified Cellulosilyticum TaxID=2643091 RepID=UPI000F8CB8F9|nr:C39 family peptidase [Cellulosilyticum sp. WCF-2]QEH67440.1 hypothetical protein EKH84_02900 [Cellulosilyticum sp. WCF-2]
MKKVILFILCTVLIITSVGGAYIYYVKHNGGALPTFINKPTSSKKYIIKKAGNIVAEADTEEEAVSKAEKIKRSIAINTLNNEWVYSSFKPFLIITDTAVHDFDNFKEAVNYAKDNNHDKIYFNSDSNLIWKNQNKEIEIEPLNVPLIRQYPELPRGCEVTSLAMLLQYMNIDIDKMTLAKNIKKDDTPYYKDNKGRIYYGNPYDGFVGDMYNIKNNGYGVYHGPITELAKEYVGDSAIDLTGVEFSDITYFLKQGYPIWVITNATYKPLDDTYFEIWHTPSGIVKTTNKLHAVIITGIDKENVYINDPFSTYPNKAVNKNDFKLAWEQMGHQAITIIK